MKSGMWAAAAGAFLCAGLAGAQSVEMSAKPLTISPGAEVGSEIRVKWSVRQDAVVVLQVVDAAGKLVRTVDAGRMAVGDYKAIFDGKDFYGKALPAGEYVIRLNAGLKPEADMSFGAGGVIGVITRKFTFKGDRKFDFGVKGFDPQTAKVKVDGEAWDREDNFKIGGDNFRADGVLGTIEINPQATLNNGSEVEVSVAPGAPLENPWSVKTAPDGSLYIVDYLYALDAVNKATKMRDTEDIAGRLYKVDAAGKPVADFGKNGVLATGCRDLAVDADGNLYVQNFAHAVGVYDAKGVLKYHVAGWIDPFRAGDHSKGPEGGYYPQGIALNEAKRLMLVNINGPQGPGQAGPCIVFYDATKPDLSGYLGLMDTKHGMQQAPVFGQFFGPCIAATGDVFFQTDCWNSLYKVRYDLSKNEFSTIWKTPEHEPGPKLDGPEDLWHGVGVELDHSGLIYVADRENHRIQVFFDAGPSCKHVGSFGSAGNDAAQCQMMAPHALCLSPDGKLLYVADDGYFVKEGANPLIHGLSRVTRMKLGFGETVETKLTVK